MRRRAPRIGWTGEQLETFREALRGWMLEPDPTPEELEELLGCGCKFIILAGDADGTDRTQSELKSNLNEPYL